MHQPLDLHFRACRSRVDVDLIQQPRDGFLPGVQHSALSLLFIVFPLLTIFLISCGGLVSPSTPPPAPVTVTVTPSSAQSFTGDQVHFHADVQNAASPTVVWQVNTIPGGNSAVGAISDSGLFTAPNTAPNPPTVTVTAALQSDSSKAGSASVTIKPLSAIQGSLSISPPLSSVTTSQTLQLQVTAAGFSNNLNNLVNWSVGCVPIGNCATGTITQSGLYTPPNAAGPHIITATLVANPSVIGSAQVEVTDFAGTLTWRNDNSRSGQNQKELVLAPATVTSSTFGKLFSCLLDGYAYAQPLYVPNVAIPGNGMHNVIIVATEMDSVFAFDADANPCKQLWQKSLIPTGLQAISNANMDIVPFVGITGTPAIDASTSRLYVVAATQTIAVNPAY